MNCPYCGKEMEKGLIQSPHELSWVSGEKRRLLSGSFYEDSVVLSGLSVLVGSAVRAFLCRDCQRIVIDYADEHSDMNAR